MAFGVIGPPGGIRPGGQKKRKSVLQTLFDVDSKYTPIKMIGRGSYGLVCLATDNATGNKVAIKKIRVTLGNRIGVLMAFREMYLLRILKHKNVINLKHVMMPTQKLDFQDVYLVCDLMETDLKQVIQSSQPLSEDHCRYLVYQILRGLQHIHACYVIHRDLKPYSDRVRFSDLYPEASPMAIDLMERMLVFDPSKRLTAMEALHHPYLAGLYDPSMDVAAKSTKPLEAFNRMNERILRKVILEEMRL